MVTLILYSRHAREMMIERGISANEAESAIRMGAKGMQRNKTLYHFRHFSVVAVKITKGHFVITVMPRW